MISELILIAHHVMVLDTIELPFKLPDFGTICIHLFTRGGPVFVELVDDQCRIPVHQEAFDAELDSYAESMETCFILRGVVRG